MTGTILTALNGLAILTVGTLYRVCGRRDVWEDAYDSVWGEDGVWS
jgi:catalase (peroxidase I)